MPSKPCWLYIQRSAAVAVCFFSLDFAQAFEYCPRHGLKISGIKNRLSIKTIGFFVSMAEKQSA